MQTGAGPPRLAGLVEAVSYTEAGTRARCMTMVNTAQQGQCGGLGDVAVQQRLIKPVGSATDFKVRSLPGYLVSWVSTDRPASPAYPASP